MPVHTLHAFADAKHRKIAAYLLVARVKGISCGVLPTTTQSLSLTGSLTMHPEQHHRPDKSSRHVPLIKLTILIIRQCNEEGDLVHPAIFAFAAWDRVRQYQTKQQAKQHATAIRKPLHDDGALFVIQLYAGGIDLFSARQSARFQFLIFFF